MNKKTNAIEFYTHFTHMGPNFESFVENVYLANYKQNEFYCSNLNIILHYAVASKYNFRNSFRTRLEISYLVILTH